MRGYNELSQEEMQAVENLDRDSLGVEGAEILRSFPSKKPVVDVQALRWAALTYQQTSDLILAVSQYQQDTGKVYLSNAFSLNMLPTISIALTVTETKEIPERVISVVGHADTAALFSSLLGREVAFNRTSVTLQEGDTLIVGQYSGPRLPEGATALPEGASVKWLKVTIS